jgi:hypothetical protein
MADAAETTSESRRGKLRATVSSGAMEERPWTAQPLHIDSDRHRRVARWRARGGHARWTRDHWGPTSSTWCASMYPTWSPCLGWFHSNLGQGPITKFVAHPMIFKFYLRAMVI